MTSLHVICGLGWTTSSNASDNKRKRKRKHVRENLPIYTTTKKLKNDGERREKRVGKKKEQEDLGHYNGPTSVGPDPKNDLKPKLRPKIK